MMNRDQEKKKHVSTMEEKLKTNPTMRLEMKDEQNYVPSLQEIIKATTTMDRTRKEKKGDKETKKNNPCLEKVYTMDHGKRWRSMNLTMNSK